MKKIIKILLIFIMVFSVVGCSGGSDYSADYPDNEFTKLIPKPDTKDFEHLSEYDDSFSINALGYSKEMFNEYVKECEKKGFELIKKQGSSAIFFNNDGYKLRLSYSDYSEDMDINMYSPIELKNTEWPINNATKLLPKPKLTVGNIKWEHSDSILMYIGDISETEYNDYIKKCQEKGFNLDYDKGDNYYYADNKGNYHLSLKYQDDGKNILTLNIEKKAEDSSASSNDTKKDDSSTSSSKDVRKEFKAAMDGYEAFFDEYIAFMKKYNSSDDTTTMMKDYTNYMTKYADTMKKMEALNNDELNDAEVKYYTEVHLRITKKLLEVQ